MALANVGGSNEHPRKLRRDPLRAAQSVEIRAPRSKMVRGGGGGFARALAVHRQKKKAALGIVHSCVPAQLAIAPRPSRVVVLRPSRVSPSRGPWERLLGC
jgi:hypothetical protein